jgi:hypothetical protein
MHPVPFTILLTISALTGSMHSTFCSCLCPSPPPLPCLPVLLSCTPRCPNVSHGTCYFPCKIPSLRDGRPRPSHGRSRCRSTSRRGCRRRALLVVEYLGRRRWGTRRGLGNIWTRPTVDEEVGRRSKCSACKRWTGGWSRIQCGYSWRCSSDPTQAVGRSFRGQFDDQGVQLG